MSHLAPYPLAALARRMLREFDARKTIFDLPQRKFVLGNAQRDLSVRFHGHCAATPFGPAAGPHTQLAQNIVLCWLAGGRIMELKTVQVLDRLTLPRPCIDMQTVGYNVEWSQELTLQESLEEYVKASMLIQMLHASGRLQLSEGFDRTIYDMSVGYDLAGIRSERVQAFICGMKDATAVIEKLRRQLPAELGPLRDLDFQTRLSDTLTLSTFHGCPPDEIEAMATHLMRENGLSVVIKLNPTLLGAAEVHHLLHEVLGYSMLHIPDSAFEGDATWAQASAILERIEHLAGSLGVGLGVKFSNTLIVENHRNFFPASERHMYLSGPPLHLLAMKLVQRLRHAFGDRFPISFSAGIERANFPDAVALGLVPVTVCTDLLKAGGYWRAHGYFEELGARMDTLAARNIEEFIVRAYGSDGPAELGAAKLRNTDLYLQRALADPRYRAANNELGPRKIGRQLQFFDCVTCNKCIPLCPNDANFSLRLPASEQVPLKMARQIVHFADFCNDCGNCDVFCLEDGGPQVLKPRLFVSRARWEQDAPRDAVLLEALAITGRFGGEVLRVAVGEAPGNNPRAHALAALHAALLAPGEINHVSEVLNTLRCQTSARPD